MAVDWNEQQIIKIFYDVENRIPIRQSICGWFYFGMLENKHRNKKTVNRLSYGDTELL